ncbi:PAS domain-containing protein [Candidatus Endoriftia persephonae]|jgi:PAS domain S-box-containing protein|uniref:PAS-domain protein n=2 Tax=Gammaproteobacteria TaxID=1236 RepID=G2FDX9_9GAMM|nr:PAS domain-containing protein [Candidatus Endoriftia persephone]EGW54963.1 PAS-domain protein [endosymbiont of Tevnia jerichonana (vent Tica)]USF87882.1 PAS domain-containing protein [Candidatus Endoriftia persephone]
MKNKIQPINKERKLKEEDFIVSKTDPSGRITYTNRIFMQIAGYSEAELLGQQQNIIRHPDMPRAIFQLLWDTLKQGREFFGYVKNMSRDGSFYWVFANITPTLNPSGKLVGYYSVRRRPKEESVRLIEPIYAEMLAVEQRAGARQAIQASTQLLQAKLTDYGSDYEHFVLEI